ncbi:MAG: hypothetical protein IPM32_02460 [Ignavibacteriae bacterium]|nr:hypothetical protein [Ignavibacteriota bacterium]
MKNSVLLILLMISIFGCSSTYLVQGEDSENYIEKINYLTKSYVPLIKLSDGTEFYSNLIEVTKDSLVIKGYRSKSIPLELVSSIELRDWVRGFFDGFFMGIPVSFASIIITNQLMDDCTEMCGLAGIAVGGATYAITLIANTIWSGNKTYIFVKNNNNEFIQIK